MTKGLSQSVSTGLSFCPTITVTSGADIEFGLPNFTRDVALSTSTDRGSVRPGGEVVLTHTVRNVGNADPSPYGTGTSLSPEPVSRFSIFLGSSAGQRVSPCHNPEA